MSSSEISMEPDSTVYQTLLESTRAIPWRIDWASMKFTYIGPQIEALLGWKQNSWVSVDDWVERMHPDDRDRVVNYCVSQSKSGVDHEADYRAMTRDGSYVWIRDVVHVVRRDGETEALVGFMFDISERKRNEEKLLHLQRELEELSYKDGLTGIPNRRMFDMVLAREWASARRTRQPLSMLLLDIDFFKAYNDRYGHLAGDECLQRVATLLTGVASRPRDIVARFGGEEFAMILPESDAAAAKAVAEKCRRLLFDQMIPHDGTDNGEWLTVSIGVGSTVPGGDDDPQSFIEEVDKRLYLAKQRGRNRVEAVEQKAS
jgi:diguanylate cyclase (GGDEF)-like protein/PAS domain S-box-containing protein